MKHIAQCAVSTQTPPNREIFNFERFCNRDNDGEFTGNEPGVPE